MKFHRSRRGGVLPWVVLLWAVLLPSLVLAQPQHTLEDITVTARKQEQRAFDVPLSLSVLQGEGLDRLRSSGMDVRFLTNADAQPPGHVGLRMYLSVFLYSRSGQYGLRQHECLPTGVGHARQHRAGKSVVQGTPHL